MHEEKFHAHLEKYGQLLHQPVLIAQAHPCLANIELKQILEQTWDFQQLEDHLERVNLIRVAEQMYQCPILGVMGQLNAGKSTVVASFVSEENRPRVSRGYSSSRGTHRFVYWVPQSWLDDSQKKTLLFDLLRSVHRGCPIDYLPNDPQAAEAAYRQGEFDPQAFFTPLIAGDKGLDELQLALLDCPDVESAPAGKAWKKEARRRWEFVVQASRLCSTILLVIDYPKLRAENLKAFLEQVHRCTMPVPLYLLVNKVPPQSTPVELATDHYLQQVASSACGVYVAFNFDIPNWKRQLPDTILHKEKSWLPHYLDDLWTKILGWFRIKGSHEKIPIFFFLDVNHDSLPPAWNQLKDTQRLFDLPGQLELGRQQQEKLSQWKSDLLEQIAQAEQDVHCWRQQQLETARELQRHLWEFCRDLFTIRDEKQGQLVVRSPVRPRLIVAFNKALEETAPPEVKVAWKIRKWLGNLVGGVRWIFRSAEEAKRKLKGRFEEKVVANRICGFEPSELARRMCKFRWVPASIPEEHVAKAWQSVLEQLDRLQETFPLDNQHLKELAREQWKQVPVPWWRAILKGMAAVCLVLALVDGGATLLTWMGIVGSSTITALPGATLLAVSLVPGTLGVLLTPLVEDASLFLCALFHLACDWFGLPRVEGDACQEFVLEAGSQKLRLVEPEVLNLKPPQNQPQEWLHPTAGVYQLDQTAESFFQENHKLRRILNQ